MDNNWAETRFISNLYILPLISPRETENYQTQRSQPHMLPIKTITIVMKFLTWYTITNNHSSSYQTCFDSNKRNMGSEYLSLMCVKFNVFYLHFSPIHSREKMTEFLTLEQDYSHSSYNAIWKNLLPIILNSNTN